jgi:uncharacterized small protein (DUF1192 family)
MGIKLEVTTHPEFTVEQLAFQLAECLQSKHNALLDADVFSSQIRIESQKVFSLQNILYEVKRFQQNPPERISRMDPLATYKVTDIMNEIELAKKRAEDWTNRSSEAMAKVTELDKRLAQLQKEISSRRTKVS